MKKKVTINLSEEAIAEITRIAKDERRSMSAMIEELILNHKVGSVDEISNFISEKMEQRYIDGYNDGRTSFE